MAAVFRLSLRQMAGRRRLALMLLLAALPAGLMVLVRIFVADDAQQGEQGHFNADFINTVMDGMIIGAIMPIVTLVLATAAFGEEMDDRTLGHLMLKPVPRWLIVAPKALACVAVAGPLVVAGGVAAAVLGLDAGVRASLAVGGSLLVGVVAYSAVFTWAGLVSTRALAIGLIYVVLWEGLISTFLGGVRYLSVRGYALAILHGADEEGFAVLGERVIELPAALAGAALVTAAFLLLTVRRLRRMDVP